MGVYNAKFVQVTVYSIEFCSVIEGEPERHEFFELRATL